MEAYFASQKISRCFVKFRELDIILGDINIIYTDTFVTDILQFFEDIN